MDFFANCAATVIFIRQLSRVLADYDSTKPKTQVTIPSHIPECLLVWASSVRDFFSGRLIFPADLIQIH